MQIHFCIIIDINEIVNNLMEFKIASWNINSIKARLEHLLNFIKHHDPDIIALQELKCETDAFPYDILSDTPYNIYAHGQKTYNGVAILSKMPAESVKTNFQGNNIPDQARFIETIVNLPFGITRIISLYVPNGGEVGSDKFKIKLEFYDQFTEYLKSIKNLDENIIICSDYNVAPFNIDVYDPKELEYATCFTLEEKTKLRTLLNIGLIDNYRICNPETQEFSWWDYRGGSFQKNKGMRIDSILTNAYTAGYLSKCEIDRNQRECEKPSDHAPVIGYYNTT